MRLRRFEMRLGCIGLGVLVGWLVMLRLAQLPTVLPAYGGMYVLALVASIALVAAVRTRRRPASTPPRHCRHCGCNLGGNVSGPCPECSKEIESTG